MKTHPHCDKWLLFTPVLHDFPLSACVSCCDASGEQYWHSAEWHCHYKYLSLLLHRTYLPSGERACAIELPFSKLAIQNKTHSKLL